MIYLQLFLSFLQIGAFSFGGGYAAMPLIQEQVITLHNWLTFDTFANLVTIADPLQSMLQPLLALRLQVLLVPLLLLLDASCLPVYL